MPCHWVWVISLNSERAATIYRFFSNLDGRKMSNNCRSAFNTWVKYLKNPYPMPLRAPEGASSNHAFRPRFSVPSWTDCTIVPELYLFITHFVIDMCRVLYVGYISLLPNVDHVNGVQYL